MGKLILPERKIWGNFKPDFPVEISPSSGYVDGLTSAFYPLNLHLVYNLVQKSFYPFNYTNGGVGIAPGVGLLGRELTFTPGWINERSNFDSRCGESSALTIISRVIPRNNGYEINNQLCVDEVFYSSAFYDHECIFYSQTTNQFALQVYDTSYVAHVLTSSVVVPLGTLATISATISYTSSSFDITLSVNGVSASLTGSIGLLPLEDLAIGGPSQNSNMFDGGLIDFYTWNYVLPPNFISQFSAPKLLRPRQRALMISVGSGGGVALDSTTTATGTGTGTLSVEIPIQSSSVAVASGTGILSQSVSFAGSGTATVTGTGDLQISIPFNASAIATAAGSASMSIAQALAGSGTATGSGSGTLSTNGQMSGSGTATGSGAGTISLSIALSASAIAQAVGSGQLSLSGSLSGSGTASGTGLGILTQTIPLVASSLATVSGTGTMVNSVPLTSSAVVNASGMGMLGVQIGFSAHAFADAISTGNMTLILRLSGQAVAQAVGSGALSQSGILQANPRYTINALGRNFTINAL